METIGKIAYKEIRAFKNGTVMLTEGEAFSQYHNLKRINKYKRGQFLECDDPTAIFWQLGTPRIPLYAKSIDMNTNNFSMIGVGKFNWFKAWVLNVRFRKWAREKRLAITLDDTSGGISTYGSMVWKKTFIKDEVELDDVNLQNLYFDQTVKNIIDSPVVETHYMTESQIRARWSNKADEIVKKADTARDGEDHDAESEDEKYEIIERWGEFKKEADKDAKYYHWIGVGEGDKEVEIVMDEIKLDYKGLPTKDFPYFDFHGERVAGRWQGLGVIERLFGLQEQVNTLVNQNADANDIASLLLLITNDPDTQGNVLDSVRTGQVINSQDMRQLAIDNRFIQTFLSQLETIERKADELCYINDSVSGDTPPSGVPFRSLAVATRASASTFRYIKTSIGEKMGWVLQEQIMPDVVRDFNKEELIQIMEDDADVRLFDQVVTENELRTYMQKRADGGFVIFSEDLEAKKQEIQTRLQREGRSVETGKNFFDFKWGIYMNPTGESVDKNIQNMAIDGALQDMASNPAIVNTPLFQQKLENNGIPPFRLTQEEVASLEASKGKPLPETQRIDKLSALAQEA